MQRETIWIVVLAVAGVAVFAWLWRGGYLARFANYVEATKQELIKCSWPSLAELKGSTVVVAISIALLGGFTFLIDVILQSLFHLLKI